MSFPTLSFTPVESSVDGVSTSGGIFDLTVTVPSGCKTLVACISDVSGIFGGPGGSHAAVWDFGGAAESMTIQGGQQDSPDWGRALIATLANPTPGSGKTLRVSGLNTTNQVAVFVVGYDEECNVISNGGAYFTAPSGTSQFDISITGITTQAGDAVVSCLSDDGGTAELADPGPTHPTGSVYGTVPTGAGDSWSGAGLTVAGGSTTDITWRYGSHVTAFDNLVVKYVVLREVTAAAPDITVQPTEQTAASGSTATFSATVTGATSYQWQYQPPEGGTPANVSGGSGATTDAYTTGTLSRSDAGRLYRLKASNASGDTFSNWALLRVTAIPTSYASAVGLVHGSSLSFVGESYTGASDTAGGTTVAPGVGALVLAGLAPTAAATDNHTVAPGAAALTLVGLAPSILVDVRVAPDVGALALLGLAPAVAVTDNHVAQPSAGALALLGVAPTITATDNHAVEPGVGALLLEGLAPTVSAGDNRVAEPGVGALVLEGLAPTITATDNHAVEPGAGVLLLAGLTPVVTATDNHTVEPGTGALTLAGLAPSILVDVRVAPGAGALTLLGLAPTVTATDSHVVEPGAAALVMAGLQPTVVATDNHVVEPGVGALTLNGLQPAAVTGGNVVAQPEPAALVLAGLQPTVATTDNRTVEPSAGALLLEGLAPTVAVTANIIVNPLTGALIFAGLEPTVLVSDNHVVEPGAGALTLAGLAPEIPVPSPVVEPGTGALVLEGLAPTVVTTGAESVATDPRLIARRPNVRVEGFGKTPAPTPSPTPAPAQITNMPGHPPVPPPLNLGRGAVAEALAKIPEPVSTTRASTTPPVPAAPRVVAPATPLARVSRAVEPQTPAPTAAPTPPALTQADIDQAIAAAQKALLVRLEATQAGADEVSNRLHERVENLAGEVEQLAAAFAEERAARAAAEQKARNQARAKAIAAKLLGGG